MIGLSNLNNIVLFDGVCNLCNSSVDLIIRNESGNELKFASLQSDIGRQIIERAKLDEVPDSILFYKDGKLSFKSKAVLEVSGFLKSPFSWVRIFQVIPSAFLDVFYDLIAANRYRWFGKKESCRVPTPEERAKFLG
ncbi:DCC1-like thiol-disulfide oxidoreductase family protein [Bacteroidia bacterium]|nr:DCC1-like thiol-disulfide oxidoreductase family protein [Bacteroidia bacterium]MDB9883174.1 DCC1-like thiol-disulfide oxidoreductase family protein [Bacteroidia bacterium]